MDGRVRSADLEAVAPADPAVEKLRRLLTYVAQVVRLDEQPVFRLAEHRLATGQQLVLHEHEVEGTPGLRLATEDGDGPVWLALERLKRSEPPEAPEPIRDWIEVSPEPDAEPARRAFLIRTLAASEAEALVASGAARPEDCADAAQPELQPGPGGLKDMRLRLEDRPEIEAGIAAYIDTAWRPWAEAERPRRRSMALYQQLFALAQLAALGPGEEAFELVWGIGLARWRKDDREVDLPLLECLVEVELDEAEGAEIRVRPRGTDPGLNLRAFEEMRVEGAALALDAARRLLARQEAEGTELSPFERESYEPTLRACQARLDPEGRYVADPPGRPKTPPAGAGPALTVHGRWALFARRRSDNFVLGDIEAFEAALDDAETGAGVLPDPARTLVLGPAERRADAAWTPLGHTIGGTAGEEDESAPQSASFDFFFPKPFNDDQIEIVRRLESAEGVVVQGPPGTGKTHTIANIICHAMATGRRVLVVSHAEPALAVLRDQLPQGVRDLAISITATERAGLKQLEAAIRIMQAAVEGMNAREQKRLIADLEATILRDRARLEALDAELAEIARRQLAPEAPWREPAADLAARVAAGRERWGWFRDQPDRPAAASGIAEEDIDALRRARAALGPRLKESEARLPPARELPDGPTVAGWHRDLVRARELAEAAGADPERAFAVPAEALLPVAERALAAIATLRESEARSAEEPWLGRLPRLDGPLAGLVRRFVAEAQALLTGRAPFLARPVEAPAELDASEEAGELVSGLAAGEPVFGFFQFRARALRPLVEAVRIEGRAPAGTADWAHVRDHLAWRASHRSLAARWRGLAAELDAPSDAADRLRSLERLAADLDRALDGAPAAARLVADVLRRLARAPAEAARAARGSEGLHRLADALGVAVEAGRLGRAGAEADRLAAAFPEESGTLGALARDLLRTGIGRSDLDGEAVARLWEGLRGRIADLEGRRAEFASLRALCDRVAIAGAPAWAERLRREPPEAGLDPLLPPDWSQAWDWAAAAAHLAATDPRARSQALGAERTRLEAALRGSFERLVRERTFYALAAAMTPRVQGALTMFATALRRTGKGTGQGAGRHRRAAREAMALCYDAIPCWIMPSWRVAEQLPARLGSFDLVIMDEASQSDIRELPALLRGRKVLVVGDDRQVSPSAAFIPNAALDRLEHGFLKGQPFRTLLLPGSSLYDLAKVMFPDKLVLLREHFRCVEPIIRFSMQFYPEPLLPLRVPTASERLDPPLVDILVPDGRRTGDKVNAREAEVIVEEIRAFVEDPALARVAGQERFRSIGVISLIGAKQAALVNRMILDRLGEGIVLRHRIACGDSATFQGNERDVVFLSMVADPKSKQAQTATHFEQRFNVALSRARDRLVLVRSVEEEELNPADLKARVIRHFREPLPAAGRDGGDLEATCESDFERAVLRRLLALGYRVRPQVGALGYRIDLVVEGAGDRRLAVECDGDRHHGPERWADDMRRQRILERVGWRFWRCWASSFALDPEGMMADLVAALDSAGIEPHGADAGAPGAVTLHRRASPARDAAEAARARGSDRPGSAADGLRAGDRVVLRRIGDGTTASYTLSAERDDPVNGWLGIGTPLGAALLGRSVEDEIEGQGSAGGDRYVVLRTERASPRGGTTTSVPAEA